MTRLLDKPSVIQELNENEDIIKGWFADKIVHLKLEHS